MSNLEDKIAALPSEHDRIWVGNFKAEFDAAPDKDLFLTNRWEDCVTLLSIIDPKGEGHQKMMVALQTYLLEQFGKKVAPAGRGWSTRGEVVRWKIALGSSAAGFAIVSGLIPVEHSQMVFAKSVSV